MSLVDIVDAVAAELVTRSSPHEIKLGEQYIHDHGGSRYVVVPSDEGDGFADPNYSAPAYHVGRREDSPLTPRPIFTRTVRFRVNIWGAADGESEDQRRLDQAYLERMLEVLIASMRAVMQGNLRITGGSQDTKASIHDRRGLVYDLYVAVDVPVRDINWREESLTLAPADASITVQELLGDDPQTYQTGAQITVIGPA